MPDSDDKVSAWLMRMLMLLPGFISLAIAQYIVGQGDLDEFETIAYSLVLSLASFLLALGLLRLVSFAIRWIQNFRKAGEAQRAETPRLPSFSLSFAAVVLVSAIFVGCLAGFVYADDVVLRSLRSASSGTGMMRISFYPPLTHLMVLNQRARIGERDGRPKPLFQQEAWVVLTTKSGKRIEGYPMLFSVGKDDHREIYLSPACLLGPDTAAAEESHPTDTGATGWPGPGIVVKENEIESVGFIDRRGSACLRFWTPRDATEVAPTSPVVAATQNAAPE